jgi:hypothetical protein
LVRNQAVARNHLQATLIPLFKKTLVKKMSPSGLKSTPSQKGSI